MQQMKDPMGCERIYIDTDIDMDDIDIDRYR